MKAAIRAVCVLLALLAFAAASAAETPASDDAKTRWAYDLANELLSPFCPGRSLADCPSPDAASLRMWIVVQAAAGRTRDDVEHELYERYGEVMRAKPKAEGIGWTAYWIPAAVFAGGGVLVAWFLRRATQRTPVSEPTVRALDPEVERKLDELLARDEDEEAR